jgi:hypothetical protein
MANDNSIDPGLSVSPSDRDMWIRTVIGEAGNDPASQPAVAHVIANRMQQTGDSATKIVLAPNQFEPWGSKPDQLMSYSPDSPAYKKAASVIDGVISGKIPDPTGGATLFYSPSAQSALGRNPPKWDDGSGQPIGKHVFFGGNPSKIAQAAPSSDFLKDFEIAPAAASVSDNKGQSLTAVPSPVQSVIKPGQPAFMTDFPIAPAEAQAPTPSHITAPLPNAMPGLNGLVWDRNGGHDPKTGELVVAGAPMSGVSNPGLLAGATSFLNGVPVIGPALLGGTQRASAGIHTLQNGAPYASNLETVQGRTAEAQAQNPGISTASSILGGITGTGLGVMAAPAAFGVSGAGFVPNMAASALSGAAIGGADAAARVSDYSLSPSNPNLQMSMNNPILRGTIFGGTLGGIAPAVGQGVGYALGWGANKLLGLAPEARNIAGVFHDIGMTPEQAQSNLARMGPNATLADIDPALTTEASGLARLGGAPTSILKGAMATRAAGADARAADLVNQTLGPKPDLNATIASIENDAATRASPYYEAGRAGPSMDVTPVLANIDRQIPDASGGVQSVLRTARNYLTRNAPAQDTLGMSIPKDDPGAVLGARQALDDMMYNRDTGEAKLGPNALRIASQIRGQLNDIIKEDSNFAAGDAIHSQAMGIRDALNQGVDVFKRNVRPEDLTRTLETMTPEEIAAHQAGARIAIGDTMEQSQRGELSAAQSMFGRGTANRAKLDAIFPNAQDTLDALHSQVVMKATEQRVGQNSVTAEAQAVGKKYTPQGEQGISAAVPLVGEALGGGPGAAAALAGRYTYGAIKDAMTRNALARLTEGTARGLAATGPEQSAFLDQVGRAYRTNGVTNALNQGGNIAGNLAFRSALPNLLELNRQRNALSTR